MQGCWKLLRLNCGLTMNLTQMDRLSNLNLWVGQDSSKPEVVCMTYSDLKNEDLTSSDLSDVTSMFSQLLHAAGMGVG
jgi:hypothetical protein